MVRAEERGSKHNTERTKAESLTELTFIVPELKKRPIVGGGCCALPVEYLIIETLGEVEGVREVSTSDEEGIVRVWAVESDSRLMEELKDRIEGLGYRVAEAFVHPS